MFIFTDTNPYSDGAHIAFLLDWSMDVHGYVYYEQIRFMRILMPELRRYSTRINAAVVEYSDEATLLLNFTQRFDLDLFLHRIFTSGRSRGRQRIDKVLTFTAEYVFASTGQGIPKIAILFAFTGHLQLAFPLANASESLRQKGVRILVVEVNSINSREELLSVTEREDDLVHTTSLYRWDIHFSFLTDQLITKVLKAIGKY